MPPRTVRNIAWLIVPSLVAVLLLPGGPSCSADDQSGKTLVLTQVNDICGQITSYISARAIKITLGGTKVYLVSNAPSWKVMFCNDANKKALTMSLAEWLKHIVQMAYADTDWDRFDMVVVRKNRIRRGGRDLARFDVGKAGEEKKLRSSSAVAKGEYLVIEGAPVAEQACFIMQKALSCPKLDAVPVEFGSHRKQGFVEGYRRDLGGDDHFLSTSTIEERNMPHKFFAYPTNYKAVGREVEVMNDDSRKKHVEDVVKDLLPSK